ncbi:MAG: ABC transporter permease [Gammaproteobacteria bacterium]|nr:ABC transporter permease [Gammaproteobacteria bacterium]
MASAIGSADEIVEALPSRRGDRLRRLGHLARQRPLGALGAVIIFVLIVAALFGQDISAYGNTIVPGFAPHPAEKADPINKLQGPTWPDHIAGTDVIGRDLFSRIIYGARTAMIIGIAATGIGIAIGTLIGTVSAYIGGFGDLFIQRVSDSMQALPPLVLMMVLVTMLSPGIGTVVFVIVIFLVPGTQRVIRGTVLSIKEFTYIEAARAVGATAPRIVLRHIVPNIVAPIMVLATITIGGTILAEAALSFLALGANSAENPTWGFVLYEATQRGNLTRWPWLALTPGAAITLVVFAFNVFGDAIRDILDPRLRGTGAGA